MSKSKTKQTPGLDSSARAKNATLTTFDVRLLPFFFNVVTMVIIVIVIIFIVTQLPSTHTCLLAPTTINYLCEHVFVACAHNEPVAVPLHSCANLTRH